MDSQNFDIQEEWRTVDQWWTDNPVSVICTVLSAPGDKRAVVSYNTHTGEWKIVPEDQAVALWTPDAA